MKQRREGENRWGGRGGLQHMTGSHIKRRHLKGVSGKTRKGLLGEFQLVGVVTLLVFNEVGNPRVTDVALEKCEKSAWRTDIGIRVLPRSELRGAGFKPLTNVPKTDRDWGPFLTCSSKETKRRRSQKWARQER